VSENLGGIIMKITVYDYNDVWHGGQPWGKPTEKVKQIDVENAECVGGKEGILAFFEHEDYFCIAAGDDGHWWLIDTCHKDWKEKIQKAMASA
jgi:hypothetical protein